MRNCSLCHHREYTHTRLSRHRYENKTRKDDGKKLLLISLESECEEFTRALFDCIIKLDEINKLPG